MGFRQCTANQGSKSLVSALKSFEYRRYTVPQSCTTRPHDGEEGKAFSSIGLISEIPHNTLHDACERFETLGRP